MSTRKIILLFLGIGIQMLDNESMGQNLKLADSLFVAKKYDQAENLYQKALDSPTNNRHNIALKLAYINDQKGRLAQELYYLNYSFNEKSEDKIYDRMNEIASDNGWIGYERSDFNFLVLLVQDYKFVFIAILLGIGASIMLIMYRKKRAGLEIKVLHKIIFAAYLVFLLLLVNSPFSYRSAIVSQDAYFRGFPSAGSPILGKIKLGNKIGLLGSSSVWERAIWDKKIVFLKKENLWILP